MDEAEKEAKEIVDKWYREYAPRPRKGFAELAHRFAKALSCQAKQVEAKVLKELEEYARKRMTAGGKPADEYEMGMHAEAEVIANELLRRSQECEKDSKLIENPDAKE